MKLLREDRKSVLFRDFSRSCVTFFPAGNNYKNFCPGFPEVFAVLDFTGGMKELKKFASEGIEHVILNYGSHGTRLLIESKDADARYLFPQEVVELF